MQHITYRWQGRRLNRYREEWRRRTRHHYTSPHRRFSRKRTICFRLFPSVKSQSSWPYGCPVILSLLLKMSGKSKAFTKEEELLLQDFSRNVSTKSSALFYGNAFIVSAIPICKWQLSIVWREILLSQFCQLFYAIKFLLYEILRCLIYRLILYAAGRSKLNSYVLEFDIYIANTTSIIGIFLYDFEYKTRYMFNYVFIAFE